MILILLALGLLIGAFVWFSIALQTWLIAAVVVFTLGLFVGGFGSWLSLIFLLGFGGLLAVLFYAEAARRQYLTARVFDLIKKTMPPISQTEREAIDAGTVGWDAQLFGGAPQWKKLFAMPKPQLSDEEQAFIDGPVEQLCAMVDDWEITAELNDLPASVWEFIKREKFFGLGIAKQHGGLEFSAHAQSCIIQKLSTRSTSVAVTVMVPNSLGPAELIRHYGSDEQKNYYLPRLASGEETPCFSLTNPWAGSDAGAMPDCGVVCHGTFEGEQVLGFRLNWDKRYITLGPVATLIGLAFKAHDPEQLLGGEIDLGITCALIPADTAGITIGERHLPLNAAFQNGPNRGNDVFIPLKFVIGGQARIGQGWRMLMESLAAGRGVSLPAAAVGGAKMAARGSGAYAKIREQFGIEIGKFEAVQESLARIGGLTWLIDSGADLMTSALAQGERPAVMSAIVKQQCTELSRIVINDAMDVHGGKAICMGPSNYLARSYQQIPIGITVEGANILTRGLIIFGQGAMRCHPFLLDEINAVNGDGDGDDDDDREAALTEFDALFCKHIAHIVGNKLRATAYSLSRARLAKGVGRGIVKKHSRRIEHLSAAFAFLADITLLILGGDLKRREMLSARFADALGNLFLACAALKRFRDGGELAAEAPLADWACGYALFHAQQALDGILRNYPKRWLGTALRINIFGGGRYLQKPDDALTRQVAELIQTQGEVRDRLTEHTYLAVAPNEITAQLELALSLVDDSRTLRRRLKKDGLAAGIGQSHAEWLDELKQSDAIDGEEAALLTRTREAVAKVIAVDAFAPAATSKSKAAATSTPKSTAKATSKSRAATSTSKSKAASTPKSQSADPPTEMPDAEVKK